MRSICLLFAMVLVTLLPVRAGHQEKASIFLRVHVQTAGDGLSAQQATTISIPPNGENIQIRSLPEVSERDLIDVKTDIPGTVRLIFNHEGKINLNAVTAQDTGRLLIVMINGVIVYAPLIDAQINNGELDIPHDLNPEIVKLLQEKAQSNVMDANRR